MALTPGYGETPVTGDEREALVPAIRDVLGEPITKAAVYDLEQAIQADVAEDLITQAIERELPPAFFLTDSFLRVLHRRLYGDIWRWAGTLRRREANIGVAPHQLAAELRSSLDDIRWRWEHTADWTAHQLGIAAHAATVRVHPFVDGNGRSTRLLADLVFLSAQDTEPLERYDWDLDRRRYVDLLREYDLHRDPTELAALIGTKPIGE